MIPNIVCLLSNFSMWLSVNVMKKSDWFLFGPLLIDPIIPILLNFFPGIISSSKYFAYWPYRISYIDFGG